MVSWVWLIVAYFLGQISLFMLMAICSANGGGNDDP